MTRGSFFLILDKCVLESIQFNGDMYPSYRGDPAMIEFRKVESRKEFEEFIERFNKKNFEYDEKLIYKNEDMFSDEKKTLIDFRTDYYKRFGAPDYIFIKNLSTRAIWIKCKEGGSDTLNPFDTVRYHFGEKLEHTRKLLSE